MIIPTIHLNGTSGFILLDQATDISQAANSLLDTLYSAAPNGRDYYPQGDKAFKIARSEFEERIAAVKAIMDDYQNIAKAIDDAS